MKPAAIKTQVSAGGIIFRKADKNNVEIALVSVKGGTVWTLPKGLVEKWERPEEAAVREVEEETGLSGRVLTKIGDSSYWYYIKDDNIKCRKTVHFYLLEYVSGNTSDHNWEVDSAEWFSIDEALKRLSYRGDRDIVQKAKEILAKRSADK